MPGWFMSAMKTIAEEEHGRDNAERDPPTRPARAVVGLTEGHHRGGLGEVDLAAGGGFEECAASSGATPASSSPPPP